MDERKRLTTGAGNDRFSPVPRTRGRKKVEPLVKKGKGMKRQTKSWDSDGTCVSVRFGIDLDLPKDTKQDLFRRLRSGLRGWLYAGRDLGSMLTNEPVLPDGDEFSFSLDEKGSTFVVPRFIRHGDLSRTMIRRRGYIERTVVPGRPDDAHFLSLDAPDFDESDWMNIIMFVEERARKAVGDFCKDFRYVEVRTTIELRRKAGPKDGGGWNKAEIVSFSTKNTEVLP